MKKYQNLLFAGLAGILLSWAVFNSVKNSIDPKIGEVWRWTTCDHGNPFEKTILRPFYDYKVLDIKSGYIQYLDLSDSTIGNSSIRLFKVCAERIK